MKKVMLLENTVTPAIADRSEGLLLFFPFSHFSSLFFFVIFSF